MRDLIQDLAWVETDLPVLDVIPKDNVKQGYLGFKVTYDKIFRAQGMDAAGGLFTWHLVLY